jgi:cephalosporin hydroxylase
MKFDEELKSIIKEAGGSADKIDLNKYKEALNHAFIFEPSSRWLGVPIQKNPLDLIVLQEIVYEKRPDNIIECGTLFGGSALYMASLMDLLKIDGKVITIDKSKPESTHPPKNDVVQLDGKVYSADVYDSKMPAHPKIEFVISDCLNYHIPKLIGKTMVVLDCAHTAAHVYSELEKFTAVVTPGQYIIVEDTDSPNKEDGPAGAIEKFMSSSKDFTVDKSRDKFAISSNHGGYLLRK